MLSALLAASPGILSPASRAALADGRAFLLASIAVVVIGGTSVAGGRANVPGVWGAALFLFLVESMLNTYQFGGLRYLATGLIIIAVIVLAGGIRARR